MKIELRPYQEKYLQRIYDWRSEPSSVKHNPLLPVTLERMKEGLEQEGTDLTQLASFRKFRWYIEMNGDFCGMITLKEINFMMNFAEIGYQVTEAYQGRGVMTAALKILLDKIFAQTELRKIIAYVHDQNIPSCRVLQKLGFQREGLLREHFIINGKPENEILFGLLRSDFRK